mmetsp:Transcript_232/g.653  ORF Transcript_232/g.653 Transcript_232/m.653 type:complete len:688 (-) Transcript_232:71-2134(-)
MVCSWQNRCCQQAVAKGLKLERHAPQCLSRLRSVQRRAKEQELLHVEQIGLHEDAPLRGAEALRLPPTTSWSSACSRTGRVKTLERVFPWRQLLTLLLSSSTPALRDMEVMMTAVSTRVQHDLAARHVLCDSASPCNVNFTLRSTDGDSDVKRVKMTICLPSSAEVRRSRICEAYGELWQQIGGALVDEGLDHATATDDRDEAGSNAGCTTFDLSAIGMWWLSLRKESPFLSSLKDGRLRKLIRSKPLPPFPILGVNASHRFHPLASAAGTLKPDDDAENYGKRRPKLHSVGPGAREAAADHKVRLSYVHDYRDFFAELLTKVNGSSTLPGAKQMHGQSHLAHLHTTEHQDPSARSLRKKQVRMQRAASATRRPLKSCAVVGSGHDVRCGSPKGAEIDAHDAVFRSNGAQVWYQPSSRRAQRHMIRRRASPAIAGTKTDFRVNCLFEDSALSAPNNDEECIVSYAWWKQAYQREQFSSTRHACCDDKIMSNYSIQSLRRHAQRGVRLKFMRGFESGERSLAALLDSSGGNAMIAAIALCERVDVYGYGLMSSNGRPSGDKIYTHFFDSEVGSCLPESRMQGIPHGGHLHYFATKVLANCGAGNGALSQISPSVMTNNYSDDLQRKSHDEREDFAASTPERRTSSAQVASYWSRSRYCRVFRTWRKDRVRAELLLHVLHALGIVRWRQ